MSGGLFRLSIFATSAVVVAACAGDRSPTPDAGADAAREHDTGVAPPPDAGADAGENDAGMPDAGAVDGGIACGDLAASGTWESLGGALGRLPGDSIAGSPSVALTSEDVPVVAFTEETSTGASDVYVSSWTSGGWADVGSPLSAHPDATSAERPSLTVDADDRPVVAFVEGPRGGVRDAHVWRFEIDAWRPLGAALSANGGASPVELPAIASDERGTLVVAWMEAADGGSTPSIYAAQWDGGAWNMMGDAIERVPGNTSALWPDVAIAPDGVPYLTFVEASSSGQLQAHVLRWSGTSWGDVGGPVSAFTVGEGPNLPSIAFDGDGSPLLAFSENDGGTNLGIFVRRWTGTEWADLGSPSADLVDAIGPSEPVIGIDGLGRPIVSFRVDGALGAIHVTRWTGSAWVVIGQLDSGGDFTPSDADMAVSRCGDPVVVWQQAMSAAVPLDVYAARLVR